MSEDREAYRSGEENMPEIVIVQLDSRTSPVVQILSGAMRRLLSESSEDDAAACNLLDGLSLVAACDGSDQRNRVCKTTVVLCSNRR